MKTVELKTSWISRSLRRSVLEAPERNKVQELLDSCKGLATKSVIVTEYPKAFWRSVLEEPNLTATVRSTLSLYLFGMKASEANLDRMYDLQVESPVEFGNALQLSSHTRYNCEFLLNCRWYPIKLGVAFVEDAEKVTCAVRLDALMIVGDRTLHNSDHISKDTFLNDVGNVRSFSVGELLESFGYRRLQTTAAEFNLKLVRAQHAAQPAGRVVRITNSVVSSNKTAWWQAISVQPLGTSESPATCVVDSDLECEQGKHQYFNYLGKETEGSPLPFVRAFSLETKDFIYADVEDIEDYEFDTKAMSRLHLPSKMHSILQRVFESPIDEMFGDILQGKHGGVVVLASGHPGVGKTLTAEIYSEVTERPLYVLELGELGTSASEVEENLQRVFGRVTRWNAVLQFDECEIFLAKRGEDLERSAIVGIFLRLLDYYRGLLFLTTNRPSVLDDAVLSRIMLRLPYPDLDAPTRTNVWRTMFNRAGLKLEGKTFEEIGEIVLNGRQIRNLTRLAKILNPNGIVDSIGFNELTEFGVVTDQTASAKSAKNE